MPARSFARVTLVVAMLGPIACAINPKYQSHDGASRAPANVRGGLFAPGRWNGELAGTPPSNRDATVPIGGVMEFEVEVATVRDSAQLVFLMPVYRPAPGRDVDVPSPRVDPLQPRPVTRSTAMSRDIVRTLPTDVWVDEDVMTFALPRAIGWEHVRCRLVRNTESSIWEGPCLASDGFKAVHLMLALPQHAAKSNG